jgi:tetratricopeptide (TPR) repeat protein
LYTEHLQKRRATNGESQQRIRRSEQFQLFLGIALAALFIDFCIAPYRRAKKETKMESGIRLSKVASILLLVSASFGWVPSGLVRAEEPRVAVRQGLKLYSQEKYDAAQEKFATAVEQLEASKSESLAIAAFDNACAYHRKGEPEKARENYLRAGLSQNRRIATTAHFNLGNLSAEQARTAAGEQPELLPSDKRQSVLNQLKQAVDAYRHCLELQPDHIQARKNLELVRLWIKYYSDKWRELDRQKRRDESNLLVFLEYLMKAQQGLKESSESLPTNTTSDGFAELKLGQDELREEIPTLREKIENDLKPKTDDPQGGAATNTANSPNASDEKELEEGIRILQSWADAAGMHMAESSKQ